MGAEFEIILDNIKTGDIYPYSTILLKGHLKTNFLCDSLQIKVNSHEFLELECLKNNFKTIIELQTGHNCILLKSSIFMEEIVVYYEPKFGNYTVLPLYVICEGYNGKFQAPSDENNQIESATNRISTCTKLIQCIIGEKMHEISMERKTVYFEKCQIFRSKLNFLKARSMTQNELWVNIGKELTSSVLSNPNRKFLAFLACTTYCGENYDENTCKTYNDLLELCQGYVALGGGGMALLGTACMHTWPENIGQLIPRLSDERKIDRKLFLDDSCYRGTFAGCFQTTLGSTLHELCHVFDLGHTETGIMGKGFGNIGEFFKNNDCAPGEKTKTIQKYLRDDCSYWTKSALFILFYHKWFNSYEENSLEIKYNKEARILTSSIGLRVVEIRTMESEMVLKSWVFEGKIRKFSFQIPAEFADADFVLFVQDNCGNMLKEKITHVQ